MKKIIVLILIVVIVGISGYWLNTKEKKTSNKYTGPIEEVSLRLKWLHQAQFAGNYVAIEKGFYTDQGLKVNLVPFSYEEAAIDAVLAGKADFGIAGGEEILVAGAQGKPIKAIAVIYKKNPGVFFALRSSGIAKPSDFVGKKIGVKNGLNEEYLYQTMMRKLKIDRSKIFEVWGGFDYAELFTGDADASVGYIINYPKQAEEKGIELNTILMADYGVNMYADVLFTTDEMIRTRPEIVQRMVAGTLSGWQYSIENVSESVDITMKYALDSTREHEFRMLTTSIPLINTGTGKLGFMELSAWEQARDILFDQKIISKKIDVAEVFTLQFLEEIYK